VQKEQKITNCPIRGRKFVKIYDNASKPMLSLYKTYFGLIDAVEWPQASTKG